MTQPLSASLGCVALAFAGALVASAPRHSHADEPPPTFIVATGQALIEINADGKKVRTIARTPGRHPRLIPETRDVLVYVADAGELMRIAFDSGKQRRVARLPKSFKACAGDTETRHSIGDLDVQSALDFRADSKTACVDLMDRNLNMMNMQVSARINLETGKADVDVVCPGATAPSLCADVSDEWLHCTAGHTDANASYGVGQGKWRRKKAAGATEVLGVASDLEEEADSPEKDWTVLRAIVGGEDYIVGAVLLLERATGNIFPLAPGRWPAPVTRRHLRNTEALSNLKTLNLATEEACHWLPGGKLRAGNLLITPGKKAITVEGDFLQ